MSIPETTTADRVQTTAAVLTTTLEALNLVAAAADRAIELVPDLVPADEHRRVLVELINDPDFGYDDLDLGCTAAARAAALSILADTEDNNLEDPVRAWVLDDRGVWGLYRRFAFASFANLDFYGIQIKLADRDPSAALIIDTSNASVARLEVAWAVEAVTAPVYCPAVIAAASAIMEDI